MTLIIIAFIAALWALLGLLSYATCWKYSRSEPRPGLLVHVLAGPAGLAIELAYHVFMSKETKCQ